MNQSPSWKRVLPLLGLLVTVILVLVALLGILVRPAHAAAIVVNSAADDVDNDGECTLREAIIAANTDTASGAAVGECAAGSVGADAITFFGNYNIILTSATQLPTISSEVSITGNGPGNTSITPASTRAIAVDASGTLTLTGVTIIAGACSGGCAIDGSNGGGIYNAGNLTVQETLLLTNAALNGGGIYNIGTATVIDSDIYGNTTVLGKGGGIYNSGTLSVSDSNLLLNGAGTSDGGGIYTEGTAFVYNSVITGNVATSSGGGIANALGELTIERSTIAENIGGVLFGQGGGIHSAGTTSLTASTVYSNTSAAGAGAAVVSGTMTIANSTFSENRAIVAISGGAGGAVASTSSGQLPVTIEIRNSTFTNNEAETGGGLFLSSGDIALHNNIVSGNSAGSSGSEITVITGTVISASAFNVFGHGGVSDAAAYSVFAPSFADINATSDDQNIALAGILDSTLQNNGGPTETHALVAGSPAIDFAPTADCAAAPINGVDQRGEPRNINVPLTGDDGGARVCDSGAYEFFSDPPEPLNTCPTPNANVGNEMSSIVGNGTSSDRRLRTASRIFIPDYEDLTELYGQLAGKGPEYAVKFVRFFYPKAPQPPKIFIQESPAFLPGAIHWYSMDLDPDRLDVAGRLAGNMRARWYLTATGRRLKTPRASIYYPTYETAEPYANVLALFDDSYTNHAAWEPGYTPVATQVVGMPETQETTDVTVMVAIVDVGDDDQPVFLRIEAAGATPFEATLLAPTDGPSLNIVEVVLEDVPPGVDEVEIMLTSPTPDLLYPDGGDSAAMVGAVVKYPCLGQIPGAGGPTAFPDGFEAMQEDDISGNLFDDNGFGADDRDAPLAEIESFGGGDLTGDATTHAAGSSLSLAGGTLTVNADGSFALVGPTDYGTFTFDYLLKNANGESTTSVGIVFVRPTKSILVTNGTSCELAIAFNDVTNFFILQPGESTPAVVFVGTNHLWISGACLVSEDDIIVTPEQTGLIIIEPIGPP